MRIERLNMEDYNRIWITSDIHGYHNLFLELMEKIVLDREDLLIIAGDSCDRGAESFKIYEEIAALQRRGLNIIHTLGNHEDLMVKAVEEGNIFAWYRNGGRETIRSYNNNYAELEKHLSLVKEMPIAVDLGRYFIVHGGIDPEKSIEEQTPYEMTWIRDRFIENKLQKTDKVVVYGHTPNLDGRIHFVDNQKISIDCGSYCTGVVGAIELKSMKEVYASTDRLNLFINHHFRYRD